MGKIYVEIIKEKGERIASFIKRCYESYDGNGYCLKFPRTYDDKNCTLIQCNFASRSFDDLFAIISTYYPNCKIEHFAKQLEKVIKKEKFRNKYTLNLLFCPDIKKWVLHSDFGEEPGRGVFYRYMRDYGRSKLEVKEKGNGNSSLFDILGYMGYNEKEYEV